MTPPGERPQLGSGSLLLERRLSVFINCPFDSEYRPVFDALVFATICCGFMPRCAMESGSTAVPRMARITRAVQSSRYSIHDLSRCRGEGELNMARFNMPLELGMAMGERFRDDNAVDAHDWLVLVPDGHNYHRLVSDLSGYDPIQYDGTRESVISAAMSWLATRPDAIRCPTPAAVLRSLPDFENGMARLRTEWAERAPWSDILTQVMAIARDCDLIPIA
jgi:hypothetical protein